MSRCSWPVAAAFILLLTGCAVVPKEAGTLANTVGRDLEEIHRSHRALAVEYFDLLENKVNRFIDEEYSPAFVRQFAGEFDLAGKVTGIIERAPQNLLPVMNGFVERAIRRIEKKRRTLLDPLQAQREQVLVEIDDSYRLVIAAHAVVAGHLASVSKVHEVQSQLLQGAGLGDLRQRIAKRTAKISDKVGDLIVKGQDADGKIDRLDDILEQLQAALNSGDTI